MKDILFRAKDFGDKWVYGDLLHQGNSWFIAKFNSIKDNIRTHIQKETVGQFVGIKDCEGKDIFTNDLVKIDDVDTKYKVTYINDDKSLYNLCVMIVDEEGNAISYLGDFIINNKNHIKVVGNIYDNPELLKEKQK